MKRKQQYGSVTNVTQMLTDRAYWDVEYVLRNRLRTAPQFVDNIELETELKGHNGCVNCLEWSENGCILASASDDFHVMLWDPFRHKQLYDLLTPHEGNIFSVKFLPKRGNSLLATGAGDCKTFVFDVSRQNDSPIRKCTCHMQRVKRLETSPTDMQLYWSAAEDGMVLQHDLRQQHGCDRQDANVLIDLKNNIIGIPEVKCIAINPLRPEMMAIGTNDIYTRVYDRRMISLTRVKQYEVNQETVPNSEDNIPRDGCVKYFCPGYLSSKEGYNQYNQKATTYVTFSPDGTELLTNLGSDHIYLYDINSTQLPVFLQLPKLPTTNGTVANGGSSDESSAKLGANGREKTKHKFPPDVELLKKEGNACLEKNQFLNAIQNYTLAIKKANGKDCAILYLNRATALMKRNWYGDVYAAIRDCHTALALDPYYVKAHFRLARALLKQGNVLDSMTCLEELMRRFPSYAKNPGVLMLDKDIVIEIEKQRVRAADRSQMSNEVDSEKEKYWRSNAVDYEDRFVGHCNTKTDIKEANYFGDKHYIVAGSDDGNFFVWNRKNGIISSIYHADELIVNCVQPHPYICLLATSGIDHEVRLWSPQSPEKLLSSVRRVKQIDAAVQENQTRMQSDPFDSFAPDQAICRAS
ncbi:WD and tetratricopeptide repeats protein 1 [Anopheles aquasalis]|uniref:WD and tetratricopeptide repeats protein 1 n=1 Tax=Anopheles aquasalis TaxID=42839 RepID=UPI00215B10C9|nr:WD and tetratricopeptide repeats protein 1 [Anopheles aquasalis]